jgi:hypothetical protein
MEQTYNGFLTSDEMACDFEQAYFNGFMTKKEFKRLFTRYPSVAKRFGISWSEATWRDVKKTLPNGYFVFDFIDQLKDQDIVS